MTASLWTLTLFWNQLLTGQHLVNSGEAQLKKNPVYHVPATWVWNTFTFIPPAHMLVRTQKYSAVMYCSHACSDDSSATFPHFSYNSSLVRYMKWKGVIWHLFVWPNAINEENSLKYCGGKCSNGKDSIMKSENKNYWASRTTIDTLRKYFFDWFLDNQ